MSLWTLIGPSICCGLCTDNVARLQLPRHQTSRKMAPRLAEKKPALWRTIPSSELSGHAITLEFKPLFVINLSTLLSAAPNTASSVFHPVWILSSHPAPQRQV